MKAILTFHSIDDSGSVLSFPARALESLLAGLAGAQLPVVDLDTLLAPETQRGIALSFDDGMRSVHDQALPILRDHGVPAHLFLTTGAVGQDNRWPGQPPSAPAFEMLGWPEIEALSEAGMRFEAHTHTHPDLTAVGADQMAADCELADAIIASRLGRRPAYFAYPYGRLSAAASSYARCRYRASMTTVLGSIAGGEDLAALPRIDTYYLRSRWIHRRLDSPATQAWLELRAVLRRVRGST
ncbi:MAG: polysaccharide deacetylase family protein [Cyanobacteriota bacterium]|nr:polysaccharide deacetylase family protein [Cyanobacteriota bacterium]